MTIGAAGPNIEQQSISGRDKGGQGMGRGHHLVNLQFQPLGQLFQSPDDGRLTDDAINRQGQDLALQAQQIIDQPAIQPQSGQSHRLGNPIGVDAR